MNLRELGALLKAEREKRGLSVREVMDATKISRRNVNALEEGNVNALPHPVYLKGYIKNYARLVGLDPEAMSCIVDEQCDEDFERYLPQTDAAPVAVAPVAAQGAQAGVESTAPPATTESTSTTTASSAQAEPAHNDEPLIPALQEKPAMAKQSSYQQPEQRTARSSEPFSSPGQKSSGGFRSFFVAILLLVALGGLIIQYQRMQSQAQEAAATPPPVEQPAPQPVVNATDDGANATDQTAPNATAAPEPAPQPAAAAVAPAAVSQPAAPAAVQAAPVKVEKATNTAPPASGIAVEQTRTPGMQELVITAKPGEACWVSVHDGVKAKSFTLRDGETRRVEFASTATVRLGNAGGVSFRVNGVAHPYAGQRGMTDTVSFGAR